MNDSARSAEFLLWGDADNSEALQHYRALINTIDDGVYRLDGEGRLIAFNDALVALTGYTRETLRGEHMSVLFGGDTLAISREVDRLRANPDEQSNILTLSIGTAAEEQIHCTVRVTVLETSNGPQGAVGIVRECPDCDGTGPETTEATFRRLFENVPGNYLIVKPGNHKIIAVSDAYLEATMTDRADVLGASLFEIFPNNPDDPADGAENLRRSLETVTETGEIDVMSVTHYPIPTRESGGEEFEERWWSPINSPVFTSDGDLEYIIHSVDDVTPIVQELHADGDMELLQDPDTPVDEQLASDVVLRGQKVLREAKQEAYEQLRESEERFRALVTTTSDAVFTTNAAWTEVQSVEGTNFFPNTDEDGSSWIDEHVPSADRPRVRETIDDAIRTQQSFELEHRIIREDGSVTWVVSRATPLLDDDGTVTRWLGTANDVTERVEREQELEDAKERLEAAAEAGAVGTWEWHIPDDRMVTSASFANKFGIDPDAATEGVSLEEFITAIHEDDRERVKQRIEDAIESGDEYDQEYRVWNDDGDLRWVVARGHVTYDDDGEPVLFPGALADITERKQFERKLEASNQRLEQFAYAASHDLQEPLRMVTSYLQLVENRYADELDEDGQEFIDYAVDGAERMREMINGLLEYSRIETHGDPFEPVELDAVLADVRQDLHMRIEESNAEITAESLPRVDGDAGQLRQVFQNLLSNAIEYSGDDPPRVTVSATTEGSDALISVADEGIGIEPDNSERVFELFQSLHPTDQHSGTGIGLAVCTRIIERHSGDIWLESEPGSGTTFYFTLPRADTTV
ncbi:PAS domain S-box protein [Natronolimnobius sp. AArcel1]|uniref:PAS domain-containing sensor histidine kinase n=1 Tax=Natronolimnobius sp. AArcel1 TaxID=1679093 RepID=UPI0013EA1303|nr:PAS domain S-box protein [Natronolimnobius sp. AArcel1]NGM70731.1 PAS domain S-box protein [Natronolimnobius sp. AArcel1]